MYCDSRVSEISLCTFIRTASRQPEYLADGLLFLGGCINALRFRNARWQNLEDCYIEGSFQPFF